ncbi:DMT family transporter [Stetteria hydrogenophila]
MSRLLGVAALVLTSMLWGTSFPGIKVVVGEIGSYAYTWMRGALSLALLAPYLAWSLARGRLDSEAVKGGLLAGVAYALGLWLQGWGTGLTTASNSAFITALHMVWVHLYQSLASERYDSRLAATLLLALSGMFLLTRPDLGLNVGDLLVLAGSFMWALQVIIVDRYSRGDPLQFTAAEMGVSTAFIIPDALSSGIARPSPGALAVLLYLAAGPGIGAFALQVYGQRFVDPATATVIYQLEPVFAAVASHLWLHEAMTPSQVAGAALIMASVALAGLGPGEERAT